MTAEGSFQALRGLSASEHSLPSLHLTASASPTSVLSTATTGSTTSSSYDIENQVGQEVVAKICYSALSRILEFPDDKFEALITAEGVDSGSDSCQRSIAQNIRSTLKHARRSLEAHTQHSSHHRWERLHEGNRRARSGEDEVDGDGVQCESGLKGPLGPTILRLIGHMESMVSTEGLFRVPGNKVRVEQLMQTINRSDWSVVAEGNCKYKPHDFASALKYYLSHLPEPLLPGNHLEAYLQAADLPSASLRLKCVQLLTLLLHPTHRLVFQKLLELLQSVCEQEAVSKMSAHSLSLVFSPNLIWEASHAPLSSSTLKKFSSITEYMIGNGCSVFEVPVDVQDQAERYIRKRSSGEVDAPLSIAASSCRQVPVKSFHDEGRERAMEEVSKLHAYIQSLPNGAQKTHFLKKFESSRKIPGTPQPYTKPSRAWKKFFTPSKLTLEKGISSSECTDDTPVVDRKKPRLQRPTLTDATNTPFSGPHTSKRSKQLQVVGSKENLVQGDEAPLGLLEDQDSVTPVVVRSRPAGEAKVTAV